jgi:hypothetical protein
MKTIKVIFVNYCARKMKEVLLSGIRAKSSEPLKVGEVKI